MASPPTTPAVPARAHRPDVIAVIILVAIPVVWFGIPALIGRPLVPGDDAIQNFPLRVLAGQQLAGGHLPVFDPYIWGGAPLLGGWNSGALYPFTFLFAFLPATGAWAINEIVVYAVAALGLYAFLRVLPLAPVPSALGAATFSFAGAMNVHLAHFGLVAGMSWIPLILLAMLKLSRHPTPLASCPLGGCVGRGREHERSGRRAPGHRHRGHRQWALLSVAGGATGTRPSRSSSLAPEAPSWRH